MKLQGPWSQTVVDEFLTSIVIPARIAANRDSGYPMVASHWFLWEGQAIWCAIHPSAAIAGHLRTNAQVGFEIGPETPPYYGVRGHGLATLHPNGGDLLKRLLDRYAIPSDGKLARWLLSRADQELAVEIVPATLFTWDYRERMSAPG